jgi:hypothetical protein
MDAKLFPENARTFSGSSFAHKARIHKMQCSRAPTDLCPSAARYGRNPLRRTWTKRRAASDFGAQVGHSFLPNTRTDHVGLQPQTPTAKFESRRTKSDVVRVRDELEGEHACAFPAQWPDYPVHSRQNSYPLGGIMRSARAM